MPETNMVNGQVLPVGVTDRRLIAAMLAVPRGEFVPTRVASIAHIDTDLQLGANTDCSSPRFLMSAGPFAKLIEAAQIVLSDRVLDVGCATGYSSAVIARLGGFVTALECDRQLADIAERNLANLEIDNAVVVVGPLELGWTLGGPYDVIVMSGSVPNVPEGLYRQLRQGGRLVVILDDGVSSSAHLCVRGGPAFSSRFLFDAAAKPLPGFTTPIAFNF